jgi:hypothetical protein
MLPSEEAIDWLLTMCRWWIVELGSVEDTPCVLPTEPFFDDPAVDAVFERCVELGGLSEWSFELVDESDLEVEDPMPHGVPRDGVPRPDFRAEDEAIGADDPLPVSYARAEIDDPRVMIASFAYQLSHYLLWCARTQVPGGEEHRVAAVEIGAVMMGFGVFIANTRFQTQNYTDGWMAGWSAVARGVLDEACIGYVLAIFAALSGADERSIRDHLRPNPRAAFEVGSKHLRHRRPEALDRLRRSAEPVARGPYR